MANEDSPARTLEKTGLSEDVYYKRAHFDRPGAEGGVKQASVDFEASTFEGYSAGLGHEDSGRDIIVPGAFDRTISERVGQKRVKLLDQHSSRSTRNVWGIVTEAEEREASQEEREALADFLGIEVDETPTHRLWSKFLVSDKRDAQEAMSDVSRGILDALSIGYRTVRVEYVADEDVDVAEEGIDAELAWLRGQGVRRIKELAWWETSLVVWGMNETAMPIPDTVKDALRKLANVNGEDKSGGPLDEKTVRYAIRALKGMLSDADHHDQFLRHAAADQVRKELCDAAGAVARARYVVGDAKAELFRIYDEFRQRQEDADRADFLTHVLTNISEVEEKAPQVPCFSCGKFHDQDAMGEIGATAGEGQLFLCPDCMAEWPEEEDSRTPCSCESDKNATCECDTRTKGEEAGPTDEKGATTEFQDWPLASRDREWDSDAAVDRWREFTGAEEEPNEDYVEGFFYYEPDEAENFGAYKLPFVDVVDGDARAVPAAIFAVAAAMEGARGGVDIDEDERDSLENHVERYYAKMRDEFDDEDIVAPWNEDDEDSAPQPGDVKMADKLTQLREAVEAEDLDAAQKVNPDFESLEEVKEAISVLESVLGDGSNEDPDESKEPDSETPDEEKSDEAPETPPGEKEEGTAGGPENGPSDERSSEDEDQEQAQGDEEFYDLALAELELLDLE